MMWFLKDGVYKKKTVREQGERDRSKRLGTVSTKLRKNFPERHLKSNQRSKLKSQKGQFVWSLKWKESRGNSPTISNSQWTEKSAVLTALNQLLCMRSGLVQMTLSNFNFPFKHRTNNNFKV